MTKRSLWLVIITVILVFVVIGIASMEPGTSKAPSRRNVEATSVTDVPKKKSETAPPIAPDALPVGNRVPDFTLTDQQGEPFGLDSLLGKAWIAVFDLRPDAHEQTLGLLSELAGFFSGQDPPVDLMLVNFVVAGETNLGTAQVPLTIDGVQVKVLSGGERQIRELYESAFARPPAEDQPEPSPSHMQLTLVDPQGYSRGFRDDASTEDRGDLLRDLRIVINERVEMYHELIAPTWMKARREKQLAASEAFEIFHDFKFTDMSKESGIKFRNRIVDDSGRQFVPAHYDHGNGVAVADVNGDGLYDVYFVNQVGANELWKNVGNGKFEDMTETAGVGVSDRISVTASFADIDNDGDPDLYVTTVRGGNLLFQNDGKGVFSDITTLAGLDYNGHSSAAVFFDYDRDGLLDLFLVNVGVYTTDKMATVENDSCTGPDLTSYSYYVSNPDSFLAHLKLDRSERSLLFRNLGEARFEDVTEATGLIDTSWSGDASPIDGNDDGWPDLYVLNMQGHDEYYENVEGKKFVKRSRELFPATPWGTMGIKVFDFNNDGKQDIYLTDMHTDMFKELAPDHEKEKIPADALDKLVLDTDGNHVRGNAFFRNDGDQTYTEISDSINAETFWPWGLSVDDLNADGFDDVFVSACMNYPYRYAVNSVLLNDRGRGFLDSEFVLGVEPRRAGRSAAPWFELDAAGKDSQHPITKSLKEKGINEARFVVWGALGTRASVIFDVDNDGDLDVITNDFNSEPMVLMSDLAERNPELRYLQVKLKGTRSNRDGLGSVVRVKTPASTYTKVHDGKSGYLSQSSCPLYFGLAGQSEVTEIEVRWASGQQQVLPGPFEINTVLEISEPADETE